MQSLGLLLILGAAMLGRQVVTGRVMDTATDTKEIVLSVLTGDFDRLGRVLSLRGENVPVDVSGSGASTGTPDPIGLGGVLAGGVTGGGAGLLSEMVRLGSAATGGYVWGATGPTSYDCSGLVWRAMKNIGFYDGARFTTSTMVRTLGSQIVQVQTPSVGDIVLWPGKHVGVVSGLDQYYSAKSKTSGIGYGTISSSFSTSPVFYRMGSL